jgi:hypothetical protein
MNIVGFSCNEPLKTALKEAGYSIADIKIQGEKTVITIFRRKQPVEEVDIKNTKYRETRDHNG